MREFNNHPKVGFFNLIGGIACIYAGFIIGSTEKPFWGIVLGIAGILVMFFPDIKEHKETIKKWWRNVPLVLGILFIAFGILDGYTTQLNDSFEGMFESLKDSAFSRWLHIGSIMIGVVCFFFWAINQAEEKEKVKAKN